MYYGVDAHVVDDDERVQQRVPLQPDPKQNSCKAADRYLSGCGSHCEDGVLASRSFFVVPASLTARARVVGRWNVLRAVSFWRRPFCPCKPCRGSPCAWCGLHDQKEMFCCSEKEYSFDQACRPGSKIRQM